MSDTTPPNSRNQFDGDKTPRTDATTPAPSSEIDYDSAAAREPENFAGTGSHSAVPSGQPRTDGSSTDGSSTQPAADQSNMQSTAAEPNVGQPSAPVSAPVAPVTPPAADPVSAPAGATPFATQSPIYVQAPQRPVDKSNRGGGVVIALLATAVFAVIYAVVVFIIAGVTSATLAVAATTFAEFAVRPVFYIPVVAFFVSLALLVIILNRSGWWSYVLFGFLVGVVVYFSYIGGALLTVQAWNLTPSEASRFLSTQWLNPGALAAGIIAREVPIWAGAWIARRGKRVTARNIEARHEYEHLLAEGPQLTS